MANTKQGAACVIGLLLVLLRFLTTILALVVLSFSIGSFGFLVSAVLYGIGFGSVQLTLQSATLRLAHPDRKGVANASFLTAADLGIGLGAIVLGWVSQYMTVHG